MILDLFLLSILISINYNTCKALSGENVCKRNSRRYKPNGELYYDLLDECCPDYKEESGRCVPCEPGFFGINCRERCLLGWYGPRCKLKCNCSLVQVCDHVEGCICGSGWFGPKCDQVCPQGTYGRNCREKCTCSLHSQCNRFNGTCSCYDGWKGENCDERCPAPTYGKDCSYTCNCLGDLPCNNEDGKCQCPKGFMGINCDTPCPSDRYGGDCDGVCDCEHGSCEQKDGNCTCDPGWMSKSCDQKCVFGRYGKGCQLICTCASHSKCDHITGECLCPAGYYGKNCDIPCIDGFYGNSCREKCLCSNHSQCNKINGDCSCDPGWDGTHCSHKCLKGWYGDKCMDRCKCSVHETCSHVDGKCACMPGRKGFDCEELCHTGTYGVNCSGVCSCPGCDHVTGICYDSKEHSSAGPIIGGVAGVVAFISIGVLILFIYLHHRKTSIGFTTKEERSSNHYSEISDYAEIGDVSTTPPNGYSYAYMDDKPPVKERKPTTKRKSNQYLSITEAERISKLSVGNGVHSQRESKEYLNPYTALSRDKKCTTYQELKQVTTKEISNEENQATENLNESSCETKTKPLNGNEYTDAKSSIKRQTSSYPSAIERSNSENSNVSESGYLKPNTTGGEKNNVTVIVTDTNREIHDD